MKKMISILLIGTSILATGMVSFAAPMHSPECGGSVYTEVKKSKCGCPGECIKVYYCTECGQIGAIPVHCSN